MKNFACLILGMGLLINLTMANLNEDDAIERFKRGSLRFIAVEKSISATKQRFIEAQIKTLHKEVQDKLRNGKLASSLSNAMKKKFGGNWMVLGCENDEFCSFTQGTTHPTEYLKGNYGTVFWAVYRV